MGVRSEFEKAFDMAHPASDFESKMEWVKKEKLCSALWAAQWMAEYLAKYQDDYCSPHCCEDCPCGSWAEGIREKAKELQS